MRIYETLVHFIQSSPDEMALLRRLGYKDHNLDAGREMLQDFIEAESLEKWLWSNRFDGERYGTDRFVTELAKIAGIEKEALEKRMEPIRAHRALYHKLKHPYIFADVKIQRNGRPIFALTGIDRYRIIELDKKTIFDRPLADTLQDVSCRIVHHFQLTKGHLPYEGVILGYTYHHVDGRAFRFDTEGRLLGEKDGERDEKLADVYVGGEFPPPEWSPREG